MRKWIVAAVIVLAVAVPAILGAWSASRRADALDRLTAVRNVQAGLEVFRTYRASYPATLEDIPAAQDPSFQAVSYEAQPTGCGPAAERLCASYRLTFELPSQVGTLVAGQCVVSPSGVACGPVDNKAK